MSRTQKKLVKKAIKEFGRIKPCGRENQFENCFTVYKDTCSFWFNTTDGSTHIVSKNGVVE